MNKNEKLKQDRMELKALWTPPEDGWWKVNLDATSRNQMTSLAMVVRNKEEKIQLLASKLCVCENHFAAKVKLLNGLQV